MKREDYSVVKSKGLQEHFTKVRIKACIRSRAQAKIRTQSSSHQFSSGNGKWNTQHNYV